VYVADFDELA
jgi:hypothetical protein